MSTFKVKTMNSVYEIEENDSGVRKIINVEGKSSKRPEILQYIKDSPFLNNSNDIEIGKIIQLNEWYTSRVVEIIR